MDSSGNAPISTPQEAAEYPSEERVYQCLQEIRGFLIARDYESALGLFNQLRPVDQGDVLMQLAREPRGDLLTALPYETTAEILEHLEPEEAAEVSESINVQDLSQILDEASPDVAADILNQIHPEKSEEILEAMEGSEEVAPLLQYPDDTAGGLMTLDHPTLRGGITAANALDQLRILGPEAEDISSIFVVNDEASLIGSLSVTRLALARPTSLVQDIMNPDVISVGLGVDQEECARLMHRYDLATLPVVGAQDRLAGVILAEDTVDVVEEEATEDMFKIAGVAGERVFGTLLNSLRSRLPWLHLNLATAFLAAFVIGLFESSIAQVAALAVFLPVVAGQGGIAGTQTVTLVVRSMALGEIPTRMGFRILWREMSLGLINGAILGIVVSGIAYIWKDNAVLALVLGLAMLGNMLVAGLAGAGVPLLLRYLRLDPAVSSAVFVTTFTDVLGFLLFLGLATAFIEFLL